MATFGNTAAGDNDFPCDNGRALISLFVLTEDAEVTAISFRLGPDGSGSLNMRGIVLTDSAGSPGAVIAVSAATAVTTPIPAANTVYEIPMTATLAAGSYWLGVVANNYPATISVKNGYPANSARMANGTFSESSPPATWPGTDAGYGTQVCVWLTYTAGGASTAYTLAADGGAFGVSGADGGLNFGRKVAAAAGTYALTGAAANRLRGYSLLAATRAFVRTGAAAGLLFKRAMPAASGTLAITGADATLTYATAGIYSLDAGAGSFAATGAAASLLAGRALAAGAGAHALTPADAGLRLARVLDAAAGAYGATGADAGLRSDRRLQADAGAAALAGSDLGLLYAQAGAYVLTAGTGAFAWTGTDAALGYTQATGYRLDAGAANYALSGAQITWQRSSRLFADAGAVALYGVDAALFYSGALIPSIAVVPIRIPRTTTGVVMAPTITAARMPAVPSRISIPKG